MKEDYLWDKTGDDAEIEALENALKAFRYQESAPPELPQKVFTIEKPRRFFRFRLAFAGFAAVALVLLVAWFQLANTKIPAVENVAESSAPTTEQEIIDDSFPAQPEPAPVVETTNAARPAKRKVLRAFERNAPKTRPVKAVLRSTNPKEPFETLTAEEKYAYDQLMLALSITGSKLKIVRDKINGIEDQNAVVETAK